MKSMKKVIPALALLLISAVVLSSASYAWFTMSRQVTAKGMNVTVTAPNNLLIDAADGSTWSEIEELDAGTGVELVPASTIDGTNFFFLDATACDINGQLQKAESVLTKETPINTAVSPTNKSYYDFKYKVKTEGGADVKVALTSLEIVPDYTDNGSDTLTVTRTGAAYTYGEGKTYSSKDLAIAAVKTAEADALKPVRVAILTGTSANPTAVATKNRVNALYDFGVSDHFTNGNAIKAAKAAGEDATLDTVTYNTVSDAGSLDSTNDVLFTVAANGDPTYVTIRVWFEGEDKKCTSAIAANAAFDLTAVFNAIA